MLYRGASHGPVQMRLTGTQKPYRGINIFLVEPGQYASKKQILEAGGRIKKEELKNSHIIVYWLWRETEDEETKEKKTFAKPFYYRVWEINRQCIGLESKRRIETFDHNPIEKADGIFKGLTTHQTTHLIRVKQSITRHGIKLIVPPSKILRSGGILLHPFS